MSLEGQQGHGGINSRHCLLEGDALSGESIKPSSNTGSWGVEGGGTAEEASPCVEHHWGRRGGVGGGGRPRENMFCCCVCADVCMLVCMSAGNRAWGCVWGGGTAPLWNVLCCSSEMGRHEIKVEKSHKEKGGWRGAEQATLTAMKGGLMRTWLGSAAQRLPARPLAPPPPVT